MTFLKDKKGPRRERRIYNALDSPLAGETLTSRVTHTNSASVLMAVECVYISIFLDNLPETSFLRLSPLCLPMRTSRIRLRLPEFPRSRQESHGQATQKDSQDSKQQYAELVHGKILDHQGTPASESDQEAIVKLFHVEATARNKMGNLISKLVTHVSPSQLSNDANTASTVKFPRDPKQRNPMAPGVDEMPSPNGSATSLDSVTGGGGRRSPLPSSPHWPYTNVRITGEYCSDDNLAPLAVRRPSLYQEYWAEGERCLSRA